MSKLSDLETVDHFRKLLMGRFRSEAERLEWLKEHKHQLDHLLIDGLRYRMEKAKQGYASIRN